LIRIYLDFDGVIADTAAECIKNGFKAWLSLQPNHIKNSINASSGLEKKIFDISIVNRSLVVPPEHFFLLIQSVYEEISIRDNKNITPSSIKNRFNLSLKATPSSILEKFKEIFFRIREIAFNDITDKNWVNENPKTYFAERLFTMIDLNKVEVCIVSRKNYVSLRKWVSGSGYKVDRIFGNEDLLKHAGSKFNLISKLQFEKPQRESFFIDDMACEFSSFNWSNINVTPLEAGWGYNDLSDNTTEILTIIEQKISDIHN